MKEISFILALISLSVSGNSLGSPIERCQGNKAPLPLDIQGSHPCHESPCSIKNGSRFQTNVTFFVAGNVHCSGSLVTSNFSPEHTAVSGHRSPGAAVIYKGKSTARVDACIRRTASLDTLSSSLTSSAFPCTFLQLDKATQTDESFLSTTGTGAGGGDSSPLEFPMEKVLKHRFQQRHARSNEHSVSSQTLSPVHVKASPVAIPSRPSQPIRPMRSSIEGLNQEIEKLVLYPSQMHSCRQELEMLSRGTPEGHRAPISDLFHPVSRSVNTQTPIGDISSEGSSPGDDNLPTCGSGASPRINRFLAREPPDGCEKVNLKPNEADVAAAALFKPCLGFQLRPSMDSAFQPLQPTPIIPKVHAAATDTATAAGGEN